MDIVSAAVLGLIQALTEFLPVSSSGHLVLGKALLGVEMEGGAAFEVAVHFGTLLSVILLFFRDVKQLVITGLSVLIAPHKMGERWRSDPHFILLVAILIGCIPAGVVGVLFQDQLEAAFSDPRGVCAALIGTGLLLFATRLAPTEGDQPIAPLRALIIGIAQAVAIIPGVSRSGSTIATAQFLGIDRVEAARFSFLMSLPVIFGATLLKAKDLIEAPPASDALAALGVGAVVSFVVGVGALWLLMQIVRRGRFSTFGWYCVAVGVLGLIYL